MTACVAEQPADARGADAGVHLDEVRAAREEERNAGFTRNRAGEQGLAGSWRSDEQHAFGDASADRVEALRMAEEFDDFLHLVLRFVHACDVLKSHDLIARLGELRATGRVNAAGRRAVHREAEEREERRREAERAAAQASRFGRLLHFDAHVAAREIGDEAAARRDELRRRNRVGDVPSLNVTSIAAICEPDRREIAVLDVLQEFGKGELRRRVVCAECGRPAPMRRARPAAPVRRNADDEREVVP